jgi:hypothetical protein
MHVRSRVTQAWSRLLATWWLNKKRNISRGHVAGEETLPAELQMR